MRIVDAGKVGRHLEQEGAELLTLLEAVHIGRSAHPFDDVSRFVRYGLGADLVPAKCSVCAQQSGFDAERLANLQCLFPCSEGSCMILRMSDGPRGKQRSGIAECHSEVLQT